MGGNDIAAWAKDKLSTADAMLAADQAADRLRAAVDWLQTPGRFPNGITCIHPTPKGHQQIADLFLKVIDGS